MAAIPIAYRAEPLAKIAKKDVSSGAEYVAELDRINHRQYRGEWQFGLPGSVH